MAQRIFCCKNQREAKKAVLASYVGQIITALMMLVGAGLFVYYKGRVGIPENSSGTPVPVDQWARPLTGEALTKFRADKDAIFPIYILTVIPTGLTGLIIAGVFAAAISSMDSILAALAQTSMSAAYLPWRNHVLRQRYQDEHGLSATGGFPVGTAEAPPLRSPPPAFESVEDHTTESAEGRRTMLVSKLFVIGWGIALVAMAFGIGAYKASSNIPILPLALGLAGLVQGALLAAFFLAWLPLSVNGRGLVWAAPLSFFTVFATKFHDPWAITTCWIVATVLMVMWLAFIPSSGDGRLTRRRAVQTIALLAGVALLIWTVQSGYVDRIVNPDGTVRFTTLAWPWYAPLGGVVAMVFGYLLADPRTEADKNAGSDRGAAS